MEKNRRTPARKRILVSLKWSIGVMLIIGVFSILPSWTIPFTAIGTMVFLIVYVCQLA